MSDVIFPAETPIETPSPDGWRRFRLALLAVLGFLTGLRWGWAGLDWGVVANLVTFTTLWWLHQREYGRRIRINLILMVLFLGGSIIGHVAGGDTKPVRECTWVEAGQVRHMECP